ncbi:glutaredoxin family protein [Arthrobacter pigmenti]
MIEDQPRRLSLLTRTQCHLCEAARDVVSRVASDMHLDWEEQSVDDDPALAERFGEEIPVLFVDGVQRDFWQIDEARLRRILRDK